MEVASSNLSNVSTTRGPDGGAYRRKVAIFRSVEVGSDFAQVMDDQRKQYQVEVDKVIDDGREPVLVYEPDHPDADEDGYVSYPNINVMEEMVGVMSAARSYEANLSAVNAAKEMAKKAIELGR